MSDDPVDLDGRRSPSGRTATQFRRQAAGFCESGPAEGGVWDGELHVQLMAEPSDSWADVAAKVEFLLGRFARTPWAQDARVQVLIRRAIGDLARLARRKENKQ